MNTAFQRSIHDYVAQYKLPRYHELPDIGLHLEQVTRYVNRYAPSPITGSMVSNYVKQRIIPGPDKKSYGPQSIAYLIFVSYIKTVMSLEDIRRMMEIQKRSYSLEVAYNYFCEEFENLLQYACGMKDSPAAIGRSRTDQKDLLRTALLSITYKIYLDQYLEFVGRETGQEPAKP